MNNIVLIAQINITKVKSIRKKPLLEQKASVIYLLFLLFCKKTILYSQIKWYTYFYGRVYSCKRREGKQPKKH